MSLKVFFSTGETSGDLHASHVIRHILDLYSDTKIYAIGGKYIKNTGVEIFEDISNFGEFGFLEIIKSIRKYKLLLVKIKEFLEKEKIDKVVLIDYAGLNFRIGKIAKELGIEVIYYIPPKVWAWKKNRIEKMKTFCDKIICLFDFEKKLYEDNGFDKVFYEGHPLVEIVKPDRKKNEFLAEHKEFSENDKIILLMPGSRKTEIDRILPGMLKTAEILYNKNKELKFVLLKAPDVYLPVNPEMMDFPLFIKENNVYNWFKLAKFAIIGSGTATLEAAISGLPMAVVYRMNPITFFLANSMLEVKYVSLPNIVAGYEVVPEYIQSRFIPENVAEYIFSALNDKKKYNEIREHIDKACQKLFRENIIKNIAIRIIE